MPSSRTPCGSAKTGASRSQAIPSIRSRLSTGRSSDFARVIWRKSPYLTFSVTVRPRVPWRAQCSHTFAASGRSDAASSASPPPPGASNLPSSAASSPAVANPRPLWPSRTSSPKLS